MTTRSPGPQLEHGHTRIANQLLEKLACHLTRSGNQLSVMLLVIRFSYGYQRKNADFTISEISKKLGMSRAAVRRSVAFLIEANMLEVTDKPGHHRKTYRIRKDWTKWV